MATLSALESTARDIIEADRAKDKGQAFWSTRQAIRNVFTACWCNALGVERILAIGNAMCAVQLDEEAVRHELSAFVRRGVLRSHVAEGARYYEVAL